MFITKKHLDRRTFLRGAVGTAIALPLLDAMVPAATAQSLTAAGERLRFGAIYMPNGVYPGTWHPTKAGKDFEFIRTMKPLEPFREYLTTVSKLKAPEGKKDMGGIHMGASAAFLNGTGPLGHNGDFNLIESKKSIDQYIADAIAGDTPLRSLELGTEDMGTSAGACDGYPCVFFNTISWYDDHSPLPVSVNPQATFERMFGDPGTPEQRLARLKTKQSMLDSVMHETARLQKVIGAKDNAILDEYLTNIRRVEEQLQKMQAAPASWRAPPMGPSASPKTSTSTSRSRTTCCTLPSKATFRACSASCWATRAAAAATCTWASRNRTIPRRTTRTRRRASSSTRASRRITWSSSASSSESSRARQTATARCSTARSSTSEPA